MKFKVLLFHLTVLGGCTKDSSLVWENSKLMTLRSLSLFGFS